MSTDLLARLDLAPDDPTVHEQVAKELVLHLSTTATAEGAAVSPDALECFGRLLTPPHGLQPSRRPILGQEVAALASSADDSVLVATARVVAPVVRARLESAVGETHRHTFIIALILRRFWPDGVLPDDFAERHVEMFPRLTPGELALPYSVLFRPHVFALNVREVLEAWWPAGRRSAAPPDRLRGLSPTHVLWLAFMSARPLTTDTPWLREYVQRAEQAPEDSAGSVLTLLLALADPGLARGGAQRWTSVLRALREQRIAISSESPTTPALTERRSYMAVAAAAGLASRALPSPHLRRAGHRRVKVAVCVSGQLRGHRQAASTWSQLFSRECEVQTFVHTWRGVGNSSAEPGRQSLPFDGDRFQRAYRQLALRDGYDVVRRRLPELFRRLENGNVARPDTVAEAFGATDVVVEDDLDQTFSAMTNQEKMHYKIWACHRLARESGEFDLMIRIRPDLRVALRAFRWRDLVRDCRRRPLLMAERGAGLHFDNLMMGDQFAVARPEVMDVYADTWETYSSLVAGRPYGVPAELTGHASVAFTCWTAGLRVAKAPIRFAGLAAAESLTRASVVSALEADEDGSEDLAVLLRAARADAGQR